MEFPEPTIATEEERSKVGVDEGGDFGLATVTMTLGGLFFGGPAAAIAAGVAGAILDTAGEGEDSEEHDEILARAVAAAGEGATESGRLVVQHLEDAEIAGIDAVDEDETTHGLLDNVEGRPDIIHTDVPGENGNVVAEVEHSSVLHDDPGHVIDQLQKYREGGYQTTLVVEAGAGESAYEWLSDRDEIPWRTYVVEAPALGRFL